MKRPTSYFFAKHVQKGRSKTQCHLWSGTVERDTGRPMFGRIGACRWAHWHSLHPEEPYALPLTVVVKQTCGNTLCVNPAHLVEVSRTALRRGHSSNRGKTVALICKQGHDLSKRTKDKQLDLEIRKMGCRTCREIRARRIRVQKRLAALAGVSV